MQCDIKVTIGYSSLEEGLGVRVYPFPYAEAPRQKEGENFLSDLFSNLKSERNSTRLRVFPLFLEPQSLERDPRTVSMKHFAFSPSSSVIGYSKNPAAFRVFGYSAFPKGPHQLVSRIPINHGKRGNHHQIKVYPDLRSYHNRVIHTRLPAPDPFLGTVHRAWVRSSWERIYVPLLCRPEAGGSLVFKKMKTLSEILREKGITKTDDYSPLPRCKGSQEAFRRGPRAGSETPKQWNARRSYKEHPYFTRNLRYAM